MTISSNVRKVGPFTGTGTVTVFTFDFKVFHRSDLYVVKADSDGIETVLELNTDYTVSLNGNQDSNPGGSITLASALASGYTMIISSTVGNLQPTDLTNQGGFYPSVITDALDRATIQIQQLQEQVDRSAKLPITNETDAAQLTADIVLLANNKAELDVLYANINDIQTVAADLNEPVSEINTVAGSITNVNTVGTNITAVTTVADDLNEPVSEINTVATNITNVNTVGNNTTNVNTVAGISGNVTTVAGISANVTSVAGNATNINAVAGNATNINAVNANKANIDAVAGNATNINAVNSNKANIDTVAGKASDVTTVAGISAAVSTVAGNTTNINTVATNNSNVTATGSNISNVNTVAGQITPTNNVATVADKATEITTVAGISGNVTTVAGISGNVTTVAGISANVTTVAGKASEVTTVAGISSVVSTVAGISSAVSSVSAIDDEVAAVAGNATNINAVAGNATNINTVAGDKSNIDAVADDLTTINAVHANKTNIDAVAGNNTNITAVAGNATNINLVAGDKANIDSVAGDLTNINAVNANKANIDTVAGISSNVTTVAGISASVVTASNNVTAINDYSKVWLGGKASDPTLRNDGSALQTGDQYFNTGTNKVRVYSTGTAVWVDSGITFNPSVQRFSGTGSQTAFTLSSSPGTVYALIVNISGVGQTPGADFTLSGTTLTFTTAPPSGTNNITVQNFGSAGVINVPADGSVSTNSLDGSFLLPISKGGTGAATAAAALANLGAQAASTAITTSNIGSQSVSYAASAGNADTLDGNHASAFQSTLISGTNIKTVGGNSLLGSGDISVGGGAADLVPTSYFDISQLVSGSITTLNIPNIFAYVNTTFVNIASVSININATTYWDNSTYATPANRAGKDFYVYVLSNGTIKLSINNTYPTGSDANNSRKIGGFHTLCNSVGTISGHTLSGYVTGDILPMSVWDLFNRAVAGNEGMVKMPNGTWVDIYLPSWNGTKLVSVYGGTIADGTSSPAFHCYKFEQKFGEIGKDTISQRNFVVASLGSNQSTNVTGSNDKGTTGGWTDTAGRRMISNIGCEDMCGLMWQWCSDTGGYTSGSSWANAFDGNDSGVGGQHYGAPYRGVLGGYWANGAICGSRGSDWPYAVLILGSSGSARGCSEPSKNKLV